MTGKLCPRCGIWKDNSERYPNPDAADGMHSWCKPCHADHGAEWYAKNKAYAHERSRAWQRANKDKCAKYQRKCRSDPVRAERIRRQERVRSASRMKAVRSSPERLEAHRAYMRDYKRRRKMEQQLQE